MVLHTHYEHSSNYIKVVGSAERATKHISSSADSAEQVQARTLLACCVDLFCSNFSGLICRTWPSLGQSGPLYDKCRA
jgi:hypothetical protein